MDTEILKIRRAVAGDAEMLARVGWQSFDEAFADHPANHPDDMKIYMDEAFSVETLAAELADPQTVFLIAELQTETAGYAKIKFGDREEGVTGARPVELCRLYALNQYIGQGIGKTLMLAILKLAAEAGCDTIWLGVWEFNHRAQEFYRKFGFEKCGEHVFLLGTDPQTDWLLQKSI